MLGGVSFGTLLFENFLSCFTMHKVSWPSYFVGFIMLKVDLFFNKNVFIEFFSFLVFNFYMIQNFIIRYIRSYEFVCLFTRHYITSKVQPRHKKNTNNKKGKEGTNPKVTGIRNLQGKLRSLSPFVLLFLLLLLIVSFSLMWGCFETKVKLKDLEASKRKFKGFFKQSSRW